MEATKGVAMPLRLTSPAPCTNCHGSGARPGTSPKVCPNCNGSGVVSRNQGAFGFSEPCTECRGSGSIIEHPCQECKGTGVTTRTRTINVRIPPGVEDGQRIRLAGQGEAGLRGAPSGDLYVTVHVKPDKVFGRDGDDLTVTVPVSFHELALGTTLSVPTLEGKVGVRVPKGTSDGRILRVRGRGVPKRSGGHGDLLVTVKVAVPPTSRARPQKRWRPTRKPSGPVGSTREPDGRVRDGQAIQRRCPHVPDLGGRRAGRHACADAAHVRPARPGESGAHSGGGRRYSQHDVDLLREVQRLSQDEGVNLAGIKRIIELTNQVEALRARIRELSEALESARSAPRAKSTALVVWQPRSKR